jgi:hypothetical protein
MGTIVEEQDFPVITNLENARRVADEIQAGYGFSLYHHELVVISIRFLVPRLPVKQLHPPVGQEYSDGYVSASALSSLLL